MNMKAVCTRQVRVNGLLFEPGKRYCFEEEVFTEEYNPAIHPLPARGYRIRYIRYKVILQTPHEKRAAYFYDYSYCIHHDWKDERGQATECFDDHFSVCEREPARNVVVPARKRPLWAGLPKKINDKVIEVPEDLLEFMKEHCDEQMRKMCGGLSPNGRQGVTLKVGDLFRQAWEGCKKPMWFKVLSIDRPLNKVKVECHSFEGYVHEEVWDDLNLTEAAFNIGEYKIF